MRIGGWILGLVVSLAQLWINHDKPQSLSQKRSPAFYD